MNQSERFAAEAARDRERWLAAAAAYEQAMDAAQQAAQTAFDKTLAGKP